MKIKNYLKNNNYFMAIYVLLQCCKCNNSIKLHLYSFSINKFDIFSKLCEHFNVRYSYTCKYGFFSLGWRIILEVKVQCRKCFKSYYNFGKNTFNSDFYNYDNYHDCYFNVFIMSVCGNIFAKDVKGLLLQKKLREQEEKFKMEQEIKRQKEEKKQLDKIFDYDLDYIDEKLNQTLIKEDTRLSIDLNFDINEEIDKKYNYTISKISY